MRSLAAKGRKVAILSRGYRSESKPSKTQSKEAAKKGSNTTTRIVSQGDGRVLLDPAYAGDEPYMLAKNLPECIVLTDKDRVTSGRMAIQKFGADTLIMDDGFQQFRLKPKINILLVDSTNPFSNHNLLPRGLLREPIKNIRRANYILLTKSSGDQELVVGMTVWSLR